MTELVLQALISGVLVGGYYALIGLGLALVFGTMKVVNLAHGEVVLFAAYLCHVAETRLHLNPILALPVVIPAAALLSLGVHGAVRGITKHRELNSLILTFGIGIILTNGFLIVWSADLRSTRLGLFNEAVQLGAGYYATTGALLFFALSLLLAAGLWLWLGRSWPGRGVRAVASLREAAGLCGVNPAPVEMASFLIAGGLCAVAGAALYTTQVISPVIGDSLTIKAFIITVLAGSGSIAGVLAGAILIGVTESLTITLLSASLRELGGLLLFLLVLLVKPSGLFGARRLGGSRA